MGKGNKSEKRMKQRNQHQLDTDGCNYIGRISEELFENLSTIAYKRSFTKCSHFGGTRAGCHGRPDRPK